MAGSVGVLGPRSFVGRALLRQLEAAGWQPLAVSRKEPTDRRAGPAQQITHWVALCPIWVLEEHFLRLEAAGVTRLVALSSTSRFTKQASADAGERETAATLEAAEATLLAWAGRSGVAATILRPTLIYDGIHDRNIAMMKAWIGRWGFFPLVGAAVGLRQPVHVDDVAAACVAALAAASPRPAYDLSGAEALPYRRMVARVFESMGKRPRVVSLPRWLVRAGILPLRALPRYRHITAAMFDRMNEDLAFDHSAAARDLGFSPRPFVLPSMAPARHS